MWYRIHFRVAVATRRPRRRDRQLRGSASYGAPPAAAIRTRFSTHPRRRRSDCLPGRELRLRDFRIWRLLMGRSAALGSRGRAPLASGRAVGLPYQLVPADLVHVAGGRCASDRTVASAGIRDVPGRMARQFRRRVPFVTWRLDSATEAFGL